MRSTAQSSFNSPGKDQRWGKKYERRKVKIHEMSRADTSKKYNALYIKIDSEVKCSIILDTLDLLF